MKRIIAVAISSLLFGFGVAWAAAPSLLVLSGGPLSSRTTYFGNCQSDGSPPVGTAFDFWGAAAWYGKPGTSQDFVCPGYGAQTINSMGMYAKDRGSNGNVRVAIYTYTIYDPTLVLVCQWNAAVTVNDLTERWWDSSAFSGTPTLTGGQHYIIATSVSNGQVSYGYTAPGGNLSLFKDGSNYTTGFPDPISGGTNNSAAIATRVSITGNGIPAPAPTREDYYVKTTYGGGGSDGSPAKPYTSLQTGVEARCNKTFTLPIYFNVIDSNSTADSNRFHDDALVLMNTSASAGLHIVTDASNRATAGKLDTSKYRIAAPFVSGFGEGTAALVDHDYVFFDGVQFQLTSVAGIDAAAEIVYCTAGANSLISNCLIWGNGDSDTGHTVRGLSSTLGVNLINVVVGNLGAGVGTGLQLHAASGSTNVYSCTILGPTNGSGINVADGTAVSKNSYFAGGTAISYGGGAALTQTTVATSDATASNFGLRNIAVNTTNFVNVTSGSENYHLPTGSALIGVGTNTSGDSAPFNFTTDIDGLTRTNPWDIGAAKYVP